MRIFLLAFMFSLTAAASPKIIKIELGKSIAGITLGMTKTQIEKLKFKLTPGEPSQFEKTEFLSGPMTLLFDSKDNLIFLSLELSKTKGVFIGKTKIKKNISMKQILKLFPTCTMNQGSGGGALSCKDSDGNEMKMYDSMGGPVEWVHLGHS